MTDRPRPGDKPILAMDFDGVIHSYTSGWQGEDVISDPPVPGVFTWMERAMVYFRIAIYSSRSKSFLGRAAMRKYISKHAPHLFTDLDFPEYKPHAFITLDDRAVNFDGNWDNYDPTILRHFVPWYQLKK